MNDHEDTSGEDEGYEIKAIIEMKECDDETKSIDKQNKNMNIYCPDYSDIDFLYGDETTSKRSYLQLAIHYCDEIKRE